MRQQLKLTGILAIAYLLTGCQNPAQEEGSKADLWYLGVDSGNLTPGFAPWQTSYTVDVGANVTSITVTGVPADTNAAITSNNGVAQTLSGTRTAISIKVTSEDGSRSKTYVVTVRRPIDYISANIGTLKYVPGGQFQRDATADNISVVSPFNISQYEITRQQYLDIMGTDPSEVIRSTGTSDPVQRVSFYHVMAFANKLSLAEGLTPVYTVSGVDFSTITHAAVPTGPTAAWNAATVDMDADGYRAPTEMEWMWAAMGAPVDGRSGGTNTTGYLKPFAGSTGSNNIDDYAVYSNNSGPSDTNAETRTTRPEGSKLPNELGIYDLTGNVFEWVWDWYAIYPLGTLTDYQGSATVTNGIIKGGSYTSLTTYCDVSDRIQTNRHASGVSDLGFRLVRR